MAGRMAPLPPSAPIRSRFGGVEPTSHGVLGPRSPAIFRHLRYPSSAGDREGKGRIGKDGGGDPLETGPIAGTRPARSPGRPIEGGFPRTNRDLEAETERLARSWPGAA